METIVTAVYKQGHLFFGFQHAWVKFVLGFFVGTPINMLCKWYVPTDNAYLTQEVTKEEGDDVVLLKEEEDQDLSGPTIGSDLMETQKE